MKNPILEPKHRQMLELLAGGASTRTIAKKMGYSDGTVRVYLHNLYKKLGVKNRTEALLWQLERTRASTPPAAAEPPKSPPRANETFGEAALRDGLLGALGIMESFLGPYGRVWEVGVHLKGSALDAETLAARDDARLLWRALAQGSFSYAKSLHDEGQDSRWLDEGAPQAILETAMLVLGGYQAADECLGTLAKARRNTRVPAREIALLRALRDALHSPGGAGLSALRQAAAEKGGNPASRQLAQVMLFHAYRIRKDVDAAVETANAIWAEAEGARRQLEAMGVRPLGREAELAREGKSPLRRTTRAKAMAGD